ncbi:acyl-CoA dehydrogenase family protein [Zavarzinia sp. CC-PAN008]|uniref:acyl-CoA dehydrogenase family protein n=1 Tax=Zavarzinia sp. CC-PAN008 TaxID=3243332 RepID=UPI003F7445F2
MSGDAIRFRFSAEQAEFREMLRRYFGQVSPTSRVRQLMETDSGWDRADWDAMNAQFGLSGLHVPEAYGGQGFGCIELGIVAEEMGRALVCGPYFASSVLATGAILAGASDAQKRVLLPPMAAGTSIATLAWTEPGGSWDPTDIAMTATPAGGTYRLDGTKSFVPDGKTVDLIVVAARLPGTTGAQGLSLFTVPGDAAGLQRRALTVMDPTRRLARLDFRKVEATLLGDVGSALAPLSDTLALAAMALANEMVGGAERLREQALDYARMRMQFGRPLAAFQSMKHKQADMLLEVELARSAAWYAAEAAACGAPDRVAAASLAKAAASEAYLQTALHAIQIHGGIGFTWDNDTHLWFKRAKSSEVFLGDAAWHRERMLRAMGH